MTHMINSVDRKWLVRASLTLSFGYCCLISHKMHLFPSHTKKPSIRVHEAAEKDEKYRNVLY